MITLTEMMGMVKFLGTRLDDLTSKSEDYTLNVLIVVHQKDMKHYKTLVIKNKEILEKIYMIEISPGETGRLSLGEIEKDLKEYLTKLVDENVNHYNKFTIENDEVISKTFDELKDEIKDLYGITVI